MPSQPQGPVEQAATWKFQMNEVHDSQSGDTTVISRSRPALTPPPARSPAPPLPVKQKYRVLAPGGYSIVASEVNLSQRTGCSLSLLGEPVGTRLAQNGRWRAYTSVLCESLCLAACVECGVGLFLRQDDDLDGTVDYHLSKCNRTLVIQPGTMVRTVCAPHGSACRFESGPRHAVRPVSVCSRRGQRERMMHVGAGRHSIRWRYAGLKRRL